MRSNHSLFNKNSKGIDAIIFCEFDVHRGPVLKHQYPENYVSKETFDSLSVYLIPKPELYGKLITITAFNMKILGYPVSITDAKYQRNQLIFNLCFVFTHFTSATQYEPIIQKLAYYLIDLENEMGFISKKESNDSKLANYLTTIRDDLNQSGFCTIKISSSTTIHLKLTKVQKNPQQVEDYHVPILNSNHFNPKNICQWDLTTQQIYYYIDGVNHVSKIAFLADVDINLVKACIQNLIYYGLVSLVPIFLYSNVYVTTPEIRSLLENPILRDECIKEVRKDGSPIEPSLKKILQLYSNMCPGMTVKDLCQRFYPHVNGIDEQKLVKFGIMKGIIRRIQKYPILLNDDNHSDDEMMNHDPFVRVSSPSQSLIINHRSTSTSSPQQQQQHQQQHNQSKNILTYFDGKHSYDQICCEFNRTHQEIDDKVERNSSVVICWK